VLGGLSPDPKGFLPVYRFYAMFDTFSFGFSKIAGLEETAEYDIIQEGGLNQEIHLAPKANSQVGRAVFEKVVCIGEGTFDTVVAAGSQFNMIGIFILQGDEPKKLYTLTNCLITKLSFSGLDAMQSGLIMANIEVVYGQFSQLNM
jgi:hypothetical protein